jgi:hypothetical protein
MDYIIFDALRATELTRIALTYDIYCKWSIHAEKRARANFPTDMTRAFLALRKRGFVPKLHIYAHGPSCRTQWSLNYHHGVGRTDGESTERDWAAVVLAALQTAEMNPGARHGALDDHWIDKNFCRIANMSAPIELFSFKRVSFLPALQRPSYSDGSKTPLNGQSCSATQFSSSRLDMRATSSQVGKRWLRLGIKTTRNPILMKSLNSVSDLNSGYSD